MKRDIDEMVIGIVDFWGDLDVAVTGNDEGVVGSEGGALIWLVGECDLV